MTPSQFAFTLTVPRDVRFVPIVKDVAAQIVTYSTMDASHGRSFVDHVAAAAERILALGGQPACEIHFACEHGELSVALAGEVVRQRIAS